MIDLTVRQFQLKSTRSTTVLSGKPHSVNGRLWSRCFMEDRMDGLTEEKPDSGRRVQLLQRLFMATSRSITS